MNRGDHRAADTGTGQPTVDLTSADAIDTERRRRWLMGLLGPASAVLLGMAVLSSQQVITGTVQIQLTVAAALAGAWYLTFRGHFNLAYLGAALIVPLALLARPLATGNANDNMMYLGAAAMLLLLLAPVRWTGMVIAGALATATAIYLSTSDADTPDLGWSALVVNGAIISAATLLLGVLTLRSTHGAMIGAYASRDQARDIADALARAKSGLELAVDDRTRHLQEVLAESDAMVEQLAAAAMQDHLTGLRNRRYLERELPRRIAATSQDGRTLTVILIDLVDFKAVNDLYSHEVGDRVLAKAAAALASGLGPADTICRFGGDEFVVLTENPTADHITAMVTAMRRALMSADVVEAPDVALGMVYGVASTAREESSETQVSAAQLLREAEADLRRRRAAVSGPGT